MSWMIQTVGKKILKAIGGTNIKRLGLAEQNFY